MTRHEAFELADTGDDYTCPETVVLTMDGKAVKVGDADGFTVLRRAGEAMSKKAARALELDKLFGEAEAPENAEPAPAE